MGATDETAPVSQRSAQCCLYARRSSRCSLLTMLMSTSTRKMPLLIELAEVMSWTTGPGVETYGTDEVDGADCRCRLCTRRCSGGT